MYLYIDALPVLDLSGRVSDGNEQGLLGLAIAPDGAHLYVDYTDADGDTRVSEFMLTSPATADTRICINVNVIAVSRKLCRYFLV